MTVRELGVWLRGERVATLRAPRTGVITCEYQPDVLAAHPLNIPLLSCSLPVRSKPQDAWAFASGLLPEGQHRQAMASLAGVATVDIMGMLERFGRDVAGAIVLSADNPPVRAAGLEPYNEDGLVTAVRELEDHPIGLYDDSELSIAGLQDKMLLVAQPGGGWARPTHGYPSTHILKVDDRFRRGLVRAEHACLALARAAGLSAAKSQLLVVDDVDCLIVERFDRATADTDHGTEVVRVHQEDACQALGIDPEDAQRRAKYEANGGPSLRQIAGLLDSWSAGDDDALAALLEQVVFAVAIGNADAHGKNIALLHPAPGVIRLAPLYDTVPTGLWPKLRGNAAMKMGGRSRMAAITMLDIEHEAGGWSMSPTAARRHATDVAERLRQSIDAVDVDARVTELVRARLDKLLAD